MATNVDDVRTALADASIIATAPKVIAGTLFVGRYLYTILTRADKYSADDELRHQRLCRQYTALVSPVIPTQWALDDDKRPKYTFNLDYSADRFSEELDRLRGIAPASIHQSARGMLSTIIKLLDSLSKRTTGKLRKGSIEAMFFIELAAWLVEKLPLEDFKTEKTLVMLQNMKKYCENVSENVLLPEDGPRAAARNHPIAALGEIIENLAGMIEMTKHLIQSTTFSDHAERLDNAVLNMAAQTFHIMHLLIRGEHDHEPELAVALFLDKTQTHRPKMHEYSAQRLAFWLKETLNAIGITRNDFHNQVIPTLASATAHLRHERVADKDCSLPDHLHHPKHPDWGHWAFLIEDKTDEEVSSMLKDIRNIYRNTMKLYHLRSFLWNIRRVAPMYGEVWLYGDTTGRAMVSTLMSVAEEIIGAMNTRLSLFWEACHGVYEDKRRAGTIRKTDAGYIAMTLAMEQYRRFVTHFDNAEVGIQAIKDQCRTFKSRLEKAEESKRQLLQGLIEYLEYHKLTDDANYRVLKHALEAHEETAKPARIIDAVEKTRVTAVPRKKVTEVGEEDTTVTSDATIERAMKTRPTRMTTKRRASSPDDEAEASVAPEWTSLEARLKREDRVTPTIRSVSPFRARVARLFHPFGPKPDEASSPVVSTAVTSKMRSNKVAPQDTARTLRRSASVGPNEGIELRSSMAQRRPSAAPVKIKKSVSFSDDTTSDAPNISSTRISSNTQQEDDVMATPASAIQQYIYQEAQLSVAYRVQKILRGEIESPLATYLALPKIEDFENDFHRKVYQKVLEPYNKAAMSSAPLCVFRGFLPKTLRVLQIHQARFNHAMDVIHKEFYPLKGTEQYEIQLNIINTCLFAALNAMSLAISKHKGARELFVSAASTIGFGVIPEPLKKLADGRLELVSLAARLVKAEELKKQEADRADQLATIVKQLEEEREETRERLERLERLVANTKNKPHRRMPESDPESESELDSDEDTPDEGPDAPGPRFGGFFGKGNGGSGGGKRREAASQHRTAYQHK